MKVAIIFGGAGYIGSFLVERLILDNNFDKIVCYDLHGPGKYLKLQDAVKVDYVIGDVRKKIVLTGLDGIDPQGSWIFNFAAVHREPGHDFKEYFDTNVPGAQHINDFAVQVGIMNLFFTSSIAPYGKSVEKKTKDSPLYPETAYGISKAMAEKIHLQWLSADKSRRLIIVRPSVIFGPKDPGNVYRMIRALKEGTFILPNGGNVIKAYGYVYGLIDSMLFTMAMDDDLIVYNYAENPLLPLKEMAQVIKEEFNYRRPTLKLSVRLLTLMATAYLWASKLMGKKTEIHPVRVKKAGFPTNIEPKFLKEQNFEFKYDLKNALKHWKSVAPEDFQ